MRRPSNYTTKQGEAVLAYLASEKDNFITAAQIADYLQQQQVIISRPTVYRQLDRLVRQGMIRKYSFDGTAVTSFQYIDADDCANEAYHLKCEICERVINLECDEVNHVTQHILQAHAFQVNDSKTVFYGKCETCQKKNGR